MPGVTEEIKLKAGESAIIKLKGLATAGYLWNYTTDDKKDCMKVSKEFVQPGKLTQKKIGASADEVFTITAQKKGVVHLCFSRQRSWEKNINSEDEKKVTIIIE